MGAFGDKIGRKRVLVLTISIMSLSTFAIGFLPSYAAIGVMAPLLLLVCRLVQGFSASGEYAGAASFISEYAPNSRRGSTCQYGSGKYSGRADVSGNRCFASRV